MFRPLHVSGFSTFDIMCDIQSATIFSSKRLRSSERALWYKLFTRYQLNAQNFFIHIILHSSTCFKQ